MSSRIPSESLSLFENFDCVTGPLPWLLPTSMTMLHTGDQIVLVFGAVITAVDTRTSIMFSAQRSRWPGSPTSGTVCVDCINVRLFFVLPGQL